MMICRSPTASAAAAVNLPFPVLSQCFVLMVSVEVPASFVNAAEYVWLQAQAMI